MALEANLFFYLKKSWPILLKNVCPINKKGSWLDQKCRPFQNRTAFLWFSNGLVIKCLIPNEMNHSNVGLVQYSDPHSQINKNLQANQRQRMGR
jgi:hypothetical protein